MITGFLLFNLPRNLRSRPSFSARSFLFWNKWQTAAFPFLPVFHLLVNALCLPYSFPAGQSVTAISSAVISHIGHTMRPSGTIAPQHTQKLYMMRYICYASFSTYSPTRSARIFAWVSQISAHSAGAFSGSHPSCDVCAYTQCHSLPQRCNFYFIVPFGGENKS